VYDLGNNEGWAGGDTVDADELVLVVVDFEVAVPRSRLPER
jgi:hypothetical protein